MIRTALFSVLLLGLLQPVVAQEESVGPHYEHLKVFEPLIGKAEGKSKFGLLEGKGVRELKWDATKTCLMYTETYTFDEEDAKASNMSSNSFTITGIIGWDPSRQKIKSTWYSSFGNHAETYLVQDGNTLKGDRNLVYPSGRIDPHTWIWVIGEDGSLVYESVNRPGGGTGRIEYGPPAK